MKKNTFCLIYMLIAFCLTIAAPSRLAAQDMLDVARSQMAAGRTADARTLVSSAVQSAGSPTRRNRALLYKAFLETDQDSALVSLELISGLAAGKNEGIKAFDRLGDLAFARGDYREARKNWLQVAESTGRLEPRQSALAKAARAELRMKNPRQAIEILERALSLGKSPAEGMLYYYYGSALQALRNEKEAVGKYLAAYSLAGDSYQLAALSGLTAIYGRGKSSQAAQWRNRLAQSAGGSVFDPFEVSAAAGIPVAASGTYSIQLGAFSARARAESHAASLKAQGFLPVVLPAGRDGLFRVRIAGLPSRKDAEKIIKKLKRNKITCHLISPGK
jgi:tetratricopeptide (TPR) repeat protein